MQIQKQTSSREGNSSNENIDTIGYLSLSSRTEEKDVPNIFSNTVMSTESLFKVFNFEPSNNRIDKDKCACFWEYLTKYTNIEPVDCTLIKDTRKLKTKKKITPVEHEKKTVSLTSPEFPWMNLYEELKKREINLTHLNKKPKRDPNLLYEEYESTDKPENLAFLSYWKPKSVKKIIDEPEQKETVIKYYKDNREDETSTCSSTKSSSYSAKAPENIPIDKVKTESKEFSGFTEEDISIYSRSQSVSVEEKQSKEIEEITRESFVKERMAASKISTVKEEVNPDVNTEKEVDEGTVKEGLSCACPLSETLLDIVPSVVTFQKATNTGEEFSAEGQKQNTCVLCGQLNCGCNGSVEAILDENTEDIPKINQIQSVAKEAVEKILDFANTKKINNRKSICDKTAKTEQKTIAKSKKIVSDPKEDQFVVIKPIDQLKILSSSESSIHEQI